MQYRFTHLDVFTDTRLEGNGLAVVHDADDLDEATMLAFARETKMSETTFVQTATAPGADYRNRIWTVARELDFAGHPSLGTAVAVARARGEGTATYVQETPAGLQPIDVEVDGHHARASMLQEPVVFGDELDPAEVLPAVGLSGADADPALTPQVVATGVNQLIVPVADAAALGRVAVDFDAVSALIARYDAVVYYLIWADPDSRHGLARSFFEGGEDPATGGAVGPLGAYLQARRGQAQVVVDQGVEMGRPSRLTAAMDGDRVRVSGGCVVVIEGSVSL